MPVSQNRVDQLNASGYKTRTRYKKLEVINNYEILLTVVQSDTDPVTTIMPDMVSPHRPYPVFVYIFSVAFYELMQRKSQRKAAEATRQAFRLSRFSASTLCRARKKFSDDSSYIMEATTSENNGTDSSKKEKTLILQLVEEESNNEYAAGICDRHKNTTNTISRSKPGLREVFSKLSWLIEFIDKIICNEKKPHWEECAIFTSPANRLCRNYFLLHQRLII
jgi:hypothetical protein